MAVIASYRRANSEALQACDAERRTLYARLKLVGLEEAPSHLAVFVDEGTAVGHGLGLRTMPEMLRYSAVTAVGHMWLAARARGIGMGWISIIEPAAVAQALQVSPEWTLIGYFCLGFPSELCTEPELAREGWERRLSADAVIVRR
jgi:5,6-dimethylbenzimidazole synthase